MQEVQMTIFDMNYGFGAGRMFQEPLVPETEMISAQCLKKWQGSQTRPPIYLNLRSGETQEWLTVTDGRLPGESWIANFSESPKEEEDSSLSAILQDTVPEKYFLSEKACLGILRRSLHRGKKLPSVLATALISQAKLFGEKWNELINACEEEWKPIEGYEDKYEISNKGRVRLVNGEIKAICFDKDGYPRTSLCKDGVQKTFTIHRLVAKAFVENPNPEEYDQINHIDEDKKNCFFLNLEWCNNLYNRRYGTGVQRATEKNSDAVIATVIDTGAKEYYKSMNDAARQLNGDSGHICDAVNGKRNSAYGRTWERDDRE